MFVTKIIAKEIMDKLPLDRIKEMLPSTPDINITYVATKKEREEDHWIKDGKTFYRIVLDYDMVATKPIEEILLEVKRITLAKLKT